MLLMIFGVALATLMPWPMKLIVDYVLTNRPLPQSAAWIRGLPGGDSRLGLLTMFTVMWHLNASLSWITLFAALPLPLVMKRFTPCITESAYQQQQLEGQIYSFAEQNLTALPVVQAFGREEYEDKRFRRLSETTFQGYVRTLYSQLHFKVAVSIPTAVGTAGMMALGGIYVLQGSLSIGSLLVFLAYLDSLYGPLSAFAYLATGYASA